MKEAGKGPSGLMAIGKGADAVMPRKCIKVLQGTWTKCRQSETIRSGSRRKLFSEIAKLRKTQD